MLDIGFFEVIIVASLFLIIVGPERFPEVAKNFFKFIKWLKSRIKETKLEVEKSLNLNEIKQEIYNESTLKELSDLKTLKKTSKKDVSKNERDY